jgi:hypothetical protein
MRSGVIRQTDQVADSHVVVDDSGLGVALNESANEDRSNANPQISPAYRLADLLPVNPTRSTNWWSPKQESASCTKFLGAA